MSYRWVEIKPRPLKDGLHDSGYRFLRTYGGNAGVDPVEMHTHADHAQFFGAVNIDVTRDGTFRVMGHGWRIPDYLYSSDAEFYPDNVGAAIKYMQTMNQIKGDSDA